MQTQQRKQLSTKTNNNTAICMNTFWCEKKTMISQDIGWSAWEVSWWHVTTTCFALCIEAVQQKVFGCLRFEKVGTLSENTSFSAAEKIRKVTARKLDFWALFCTSSRSKKSTTNQKTPLHLPKRTWTNESFSAANEKWEGSDARKNPFVRSPETFRWQSLISLACASQVCLYVPSCVSNFCFCLQLLSFSQFLTIFGSNVPCSTFSLFMTSLNIQSSAALVSHCSTGHSEHWITMAAGLTQNAFTDKTILYKYQELPVQDKVTQSSTQLFILVFAFACKHRSAYWFCFVFLWIVCLQTCGLFPLASEQRTTITSLRPHWLVKRIINLILGHAGGQQWKQFQGGPENPPFDFSGPSDVHMDWRHRRTNPRQN